MIVSLLEGSHMLTVFVGEVLDLFESQVVELHQLHSWERLYVEVSDTSGKLQARKVDFHEFNYRLP
jgi:hypothetical protein